MYWLKENGLYYYNVDKGDPEFNNELRRNETNTFAIISSLPKRPSKAKRRQYYYKLGIGRTDGYLSFRRLKNAIQFAEQTIKWIRELGV
jgi:hypothetical protein